MTLLAAVPPSDAALLSRLFQMRSDGWNSLNPPVFAVIEKDAEPAALLV